MPNALVGLGAGRDIFGGSYTFSATQHQGTTKAFLSVVHNGRWVPVQDAALGY